MIFKNKNWGLLTFAFLLLSVPIQADTGYKIIDRRGKIKIRLHNQGNKVIRLQGGVNVQLRPDDSIMLFQGAQIHLRFPDKSKHQFKGPFYVSIKELENQTANGKQMPKLDQPGLWETIEPIFEAEGGKNPLEARGDWVKSKQFYDQITPFVSLPTVTDTPDTPAVRGHKIKLKAALEKTEILYHSFSKPTKTVIQGLIHKHFGMHKTALSMVFSGYEEILNFRERETDRAVMEYYLLLKFLPIVIQIQSNVETENNKKEEASHRFPLNQQTIAANLDLWWTVFLVSEDKLIPIEKTYENSLMPQKYFTLKKRKQRGEAEAKGKSQCYIIAASPIQSALTKYEDLDLAEKEFLTTRKPSILLNGKNTRSSPCQAFNVVVVKKCF